MATMNLYKGKLVVDIVTAVETDEEKAMMDKAHEGFSTELFNEIQALLGAKGYISHSIGVTLENDGEASDIDLKMIQKDRVESERKAKSIYNKANRISISID